MFRKFEKIAVRRMDSAIPPSYNGTTDPMQTGIKKS